MVEPGLDLHEWQTEWEALEPLVEDSPRVAVVVPVDVPLLSAASIKTLAAACADAAVPPAGPLPGACRKSALRLLERRLAAGELALRDALTELEVRLVELDPRELANVNTRADLEALP